MAETYPVLIKGTTIPSVQGETKLQKERDDKSPDKECKSHGRNSSIQLMCYICDKVSHVPTYESNNSMSIQYFTCQHLAMMTPNKCFILIKNKDLCIPYLYPDETQDQGKHKDGK